jgi:prepilin-type N-terminal cleavage/methylation domain-containing protein
VDRGFSLVEVLIAAALMTLAMIGLAQLSIVSVRMSHVARVTTIATALASQKTAQLKALTWAFDNAGATVSDTATDTASSPEQPTGGTGLAPSPSDALEQSAGGYFDFLDKSGRSLGGGAGPPAGAAYIRRWSIDQLLGGDSLVLQVSVRPMSGSDSGGPRRPEEARVVAVKTRKSG